jgi:nitroreductase
VNPDKIADTVEGVHDLIRERWSPRSFEDREVSTKDLQIILEAARWAASSSNEQPWRFVVATKADPAGYARILDLLVPFNQEWAKHAPVLIVMAAKKTMASRDGKQNDYALHDAGQALAQLMLQAIAIGLHAHAMAGFDHEKAREVLGIPEDFAVGAAVAVGYEGSPDQLIERYRHIEVAKRQRKPLSELVFSGSWNTPLRF